METAPHQTTLEADLDATTLTAEPSTVVGEVAEDSTVTAADFIPSAAITGDDTNTRTLTLVNKGQAGAGNVTVATLAFTTGINGVAGDAHALTLAAVNVAAGDVLELVETHGGTGLVNPGGKVDVTLTRR